MKTTIKYSLHTQKNLFRPEEPEKAYATMQLTGTLDINALAAHIHEHNSIYSKGTIVGVLTDMCACVKEAITEGNAIELGGLGRFTPTITSEGASATVDDEGNPITAMQAFTEANILGVNVNYQPGSDVDFKRSDFDFEYVPTRKAQAAAKQAEKKGQKSADWSGDNGDDTTEP